VFGIGLIKGSEIQEAVKGKVRKVPWICINIWGNFLAFGDYTESREEKKVDSYRKLPS
jgi:hypothetical protein